MWRESPGRRNCRDGTHGEAVSPIVVVPVEAVRTVSVPVHVLSVRVTVLGTTPIVVVAYERRSFIARARRFEDDGELRVTPTRGARPAGDPFQK